MTPIDRVFIIGPMGAGKTTIGRRLARRLGLGFMDLDEALEARTGVDIPRIFDIEGEAGFRRREAMLLDELTRCPATVLATGGGAVLDPANRERLAARGVVVYLQTSVAAQLRRTRGSSRPLIQGEDPETRLTELMATRGPIYESLADVIVGTEDGNPERVAERLADRLQQPGPVHA
ncbi:shikimate kinase [Spiribacter pallidus]|jgi:shikimate kinase|uniref:Shikimate kinase n=1 Tax=Spiribacter pallidus TaxID=1987936 RepID=A0ABV3TDS3_9GAMM